MRSTRITLIVAVIGSFVTGAFISSPELRAYAANTIGSADIINNSILSVDIKDGEVKTVDLANNAITSAKIKDGEVKAAEIATDAVGASEIAKDAVGASEIMGVDKLIFAECAIPTGSGAPGSSVTYSCAIAGVDSEDNVVATLTSSNIDCYALIASDLGEGFVSIRLKNICDYFTTRPTSIVSVIVYDELPDKIPPF